MKIVEKRQLGTLLFRVVLAMVLTLVLCSLSLILVYAEGQAVGLKDGEWQKFAESIPDDSAELLPEGALDSENSFGAAVEEMSSFEYIVGEIANAVGIGLEGTLKLALGISAILVLSAVFSAAGSSMGNETLCSAVRFCSSGALFATVIYAEYSQLEAIERFFNSVSQLMSGIIPVTASIWAMGGNVSTAAAGSSSFYVALAICNRLFAKTIVPMASVMLVLALCDAMSEDMRAGKLMTALKKIYSFFLGLVMSILLSTMAAQTAITSASDSATARTARLVSGSVIPVLGGSVGEALRTLAGGVGYLKSVVGIGGMLMVFFLLLPVGLSVLLSRFVFLLTGGIADILGCSGEARLLENLGEIYGCILAVISAVSLTFIFALCIFTQTVVAVA